MEYKAKPEYEKCVEISTKASIREMIAPGAIALIVPIIVGFIFGPEVLGGVLAGVTVSGVLMGMFQSNAGGAWDNAKKSFEKGVEINGQTYFKGSEPHKAAVTGDTVGDPFKDTSGPSMNILIKLMGIVLLVYTAIFGFLGANVFDTLEHLGDIDWKNFSISDLFSGLTFYGGLICGGATVYIISSRKGIHWKHISDVAAPAMMLAYGIGRLGCHFSGDGDWGIANLSGTPAALSFLPDWFFAYNYPNNVANMGELIPGCTGPYCMQLVPPVYPTPLYEALVCISLFFVLWGLRKKIKTPGILFAIYLIFNGLERFFVEKIRHNPELAIGFTQAEMISFTLILLGFFGLYYFNKTKSIPQKV